MTGSFANNRTDQFILNQGQIKPVAPCRGEYVKPCFPGAVTASELAFDGICRTETAWKTLSRVPQTIHIILSIGVVKVIESKGQKTLKAARYTQHCLPILHSLRIRDVEIRPELRAGHEWKSQEKF
ncbi:hypothetical protein EVAR_6614_1 [Eumeta japonica]|uniref:Uncharacterized protein n=1 Tax=Eumeta variegata TaxID=151549 RepID=A0A4C1TKD6_EUMVA|nr:hypothetical protein EVAR_6614_1 [Eumeta japonica]